MNSTVWEISERMKREIDHAIEYQQTIHIAPYIEEAYEKGYQGESGLDISSIRVNYHLINSLTDRVLYNVQNGIVTKLSDYIQEAFDQGRIDAQEAFDQGHIDAMDNEYNPDIVSVVDEEGKEHVFEELDRIETDTGRYVALLPMYDDPQEMLDDSGELIILRVEEDDDGDTYLCPIEDENEFNEVGQAFEERLSDMFDFEDEE